MPSPRPVSDRKNEPMAVRGAPSMVAMGTYTQTHGTISQSNITTREAWPVVIATIVSFTICACTLLASKLDLPTVCILPARCSVNKMTDVKPHHNNFNFNSSYKSL